MRLRFGLAALLGCVGLSCAALIGIEDRLPDDVAGQDSGAADAGRTPPGDDGAVDAPVDTSAPTYGVGDGHWGPLIVGAQLAVNAYAPLTAATAAGSAQIAYGAVRGQPVIVGDLVVVWQSAVASGPIADLAQSNLGVWEIARVTAVLATDDASAGGQLTLDHPLTNAYALGAQIVRVPEYTDVDISAMNDIHALAWDGTSGGMVAFYVKGTLTNNGVVQATGTGFRGGVGTVTGTSPSNCTAADGVPSAGYAHKGEGFVTSTWPDAGGLGSATLGGGGGDCYNAGGGGGGNGGTGGQGGFSGDGARDVGGRGGVAFPAVSVLERLTMGGGGGAGEVDNGRLINGGAGGGVILIRAHEIAIPGGRYVARGNNPGMKADQSGGAGGGAGGSILLQSAGTLGCQIASVLGGAGASLETTDNNNGPGGGGAGGRAFVQAGAAACSMEVKAGQAGRDITNTMATHGALPEAGAEANPPFVGTAQLVAQPYCGTCP